MANMLEGLVLWHWVQTGKLRKMRLVWAVCLVASLVLDFQLARSLGLAGQRQVQG